MSFADACVEGELQNRAIALHQAFGHLRATPRVKHKAQFVFSCSGYGGSYEIIRSKIDAPDSPWLYDHMIDFASRKAKPGNVYVFEGTYYATTSGRGIFQGKTRRIAIR